MSARAPKLPPPSSSVSVVDAARDEATTLELLREAVSETRDLVRIELALARAEVTFEIERARRAAVAFAIAVASLVMVLCSLSVTLVLAFGGTVVASLGIAAVMLAVGVVASVAGYALLPKKPLERTIERWESDVNQLKERIA